MNKKGVKQHLSLKCKRCNNPFTVEVLPHELRSGKYPKHCSRSCSNIRQHTNETKDKIRKSSIKNIFLKDPNYSREPKTCMQCGDPVKGRQRKYCSYKCSGISRSLNYTTEQRVKARNRMLKRIQDNPNCHPNKLCAGIKRSYPERFFQAYIESLGLVEGVDFKTQHKIGCYYVDFFFPQLNIALEIDGERWHNASEKEMIREQFLKERCDLVRLKAKPLTQKKYQNEIKELVERLVGFQPTV